MATATKGRRTASKRPARQMNPTRRDHLMVVATREFLEKGYAGCSLDGVSQASGVGKMTIYKHFHDKAGLFRAIMTRAVDKIEHNIEELLDEKEDVEKVLTRVATHLYEAPHDRQHSLTRLLVAEAERFPELAQTYFHNLLGRGLSPLARYFQAMNAKGILKIENTLLAAEQFGALATNGVLFLIAVHRDNPFYREQLTQNCVKLFLDGCRAK